MRRESRKDSDRWREAQDPAELAIYARWPWHFTQSQKCWAHLLRKAIKLTLQAPDNLDYRTFADRLLEIYRAACRIKQDNDLAGRGRKIIWLDDKILALYGSLWSANLAPLEGLANDGRRLVNEVMRLMLAEKLFPSVTAKLVEQPNGTTQTVGATNNEAERTLRSPAQAFLFQVADGLRSPKSPTRLRRQETHTERTSGRSTTRTELSTTSDLTAAERFALARTLKSLRERVA